MLSSYYTEYVTSPAGMTTIIRPKEIIDTFESIFNISYIVGAGLEYKKFLNILRSNARRPPRIRIICWTFTYSYYTDYPKSVTRSLAFEQP